MRRATRRRLLRITALLAGVLALAAASLLYVRLTAPPLREWLLGRWAAEGEETWNDGPVQHVRAQAEFRPDGTFNWAHHTWGEGWSASSEIPDPTKPDDEARWEVIRQHDRHTLVVRFQLLEASLRFRDADEFTASYSESSPQRGHGTLTFRRVPR